MEYNMKHKYTTDDLHSCGIDRKALEDLVERSHNKYNADKVNKDDDTQKSYMIYRYIVDNQVTSLRECMDYVFSNSLWSAWRRGQSTFKDLIKDNHKEFREGRKLQDNYNQALYNLARISDLNGMYRELTEYQNRLLYEAGFKTISLKDVENERKTKQIEKIEQIEI